jgi:hypothetical protein
MKKLRKELIDGGREGLPLKPFEPVVTGVFADNGAVFLLYETVVVFLVVSGLRRVRDCRQ